MCGLCGHKGDWELTVKISMDLAEREVEDHCHKLEIVMAWGLGEALGTQSINLSGSRRGFAVTFLGEELIGSRFGPVDVSALGSWRVTWT